MPTIMPEGTRVPAGGDAYDLTNDLRRMMASATTIVPVANASARTTLLAGLAADSRPVSPADPAVQYQADTGNLQIDDGAGLRVFPKGVAGWTPLAPAAIPLVAGYGPLPGYGALRYEVDSMGYCRLMGGMLRTGATASGLTTFGVGNLPAGGRPGVARGMAIATERGPATLSIAVDGTMTLIYGAAINVVQNAWFMILDGLAFRMAE